MVPVVVVQVPDVTVVFGFGLSLVVLSLELSNECVPVVVVGEVPDVVVTVVPVVVSAVVPVVSGH